jgi:hypothetical protein
MGQQEYIEAKSGAGIATYSRTVYQYCDKGMHS